MKYEQIDRSVICQIDELERQLNTFHGFRHLWAELVANHQECGLTQHKLEVAQCERLTLALGVAYSTAKTLGITSLGITWVATNKELQAAVLAESKIARVRNYAIVLKSNSDHNPKQLAIANEILSRLE